MVIQESVHIEGSAGFRMSAAVSKYIAGVLEKAHEKTEKTQREIIDRTGKIYVTRTHTSDKKGAGKSASPFKSLSIEDSSKRGQSRPGDVLKLYSSLLKYSGTPIEPI